MLANMPGTVLHHEGVHIRPFAAGRCCSLVRCCNVSPPAARRRPAGQGTPRGETPREKPADRTHGYGAVRNGAVPGGSEPCCAVRYCVVLYCNSLSWAGPGDPRYCTVLYCIPSPSHTPKLCADGRGWVYCSRRSDPPPAGDSDGSQGPMIPAGPNCATKSNDMTPELCCAVLRCAERDGAVQCCGTVPLPYRTCGTVPPLVLDRSLRELLDRSLQNDAAEQIKNRRGRNHPLNSREASWAAWASACPRPPSTPPATGGTTRRRRATLAKSARAT